jgi:hypothetical protein
MIEPPAPKVNRFTIDRLIALTAWQVLASKGYDSEVERRGAEGC